MAVNLSPVFGVAGQLFNDNGDPLAGGKIYTYLAGTTTPAATYTSSLGSTAHSNPIVLDGAGRVPTGEIWLTDGITYKFVVEDAASNLIGTYDNLTGINSNFVAFTNQQEIQTATAGQTVFNLTTMQYQPGTNSLSVFVDGVNQYGPGAQYAYVETDSDTVTFVTGLHVGASVKFTTSQLNSSGAVDAQQVTYDPPFTNSVFTNVEAKLAQTISVKDFGAIGDGVADDTLAIQNAHNASVSNNYFGIYFPSGTYKVTSTINWSPFVCAYANNRVIITTNIATGNLFHISAEYGLPTNTPAESSKSTFGGNFLIENTNDVNTAIALYFGTTTTNVAKMAWGIDVKSLQINNFYGAIEFGNVSFLVHFYDVGILGNYDTGLMANRYGICQQSTVTNTGENIQFTGGVFAHLNACIKGNSNPATNGLFISFASVSFDYNTCVIADVSDTQSIYDFWRPHLEWDGASQYFNAKGCIVRVLDANIYVGPGTYASPLLATASNGGEFSIQNAVHNYGTAGGTLMAIADNTSTIQADSIPKYVAYKPTVYINNTAKGNIQYFVQQLTKSYTPVWTASVTNPTLGDGTLIGQYCYDGQWVDCRIRLTIGSTTTIGSGIYNFSLPFTSADDGFYSVGSVWVNDNGVAIRTGTCRITPNSAIVSCYSNTTGDVYSNTVPQTWSTNDELEIQIRYRQLFAGQND